MNGGRKRLLVIAGEFPPLKTIGRLRTVKFVEHLRAHGWDSTVIAIEPSGQEPNYDPRLLAEIPAGTEVLRVPLPDYEVRIAQAVKRLLGRSPAPSTGAAMAPAGAAAASPAPPANAAGGGRSPLDLAHGALRWTMRNVVLIPDNYRPWVAGVTATALKALSEKPHAAVYTTLPPFSAAYAGRAIRRATGLPWLVDYRDLWHGDVLREWLPAWRRRLELRSERSLMREADAIVTVSEQKTESVRRLIPQARGRFATLTNGIDTELYSAERRTRPFDERTVEFVYTGRLFKNRRGYAFTEALGRLKRRRPELAAPVRVRFLGDVSPEIRARHDALIAQYGLQGHFDFAGDVPFAVARAAQVNCDWLLLIVDTGETSDGVIPGKLFEYVASGRPIFALCDPGATPDIIGRARLGTVVGAEDVAACERELERVLAQPVPRETEPDRDYLAQFDRRAIAARFANLLDEITSAAPRAAARETAVAG